MAVTNSSASGKGWVRTGLLLMTPTTRFKVRIVADMNVSNGLLFVGVGLAEGISTHMFSKSPGMSFWYDGYYGSVNTDHGADGPYPKSKTAWKPTIDLIFNGYALTFAVNGAIQPGSWTVCDAFHVFAYAYYGGTVTIATV